MKVAGIYQNWFFRSFFFFFPDFFEAEPKSLDVIRVYLKQFQAADGKKSPISIAQLTNHPAFPSGHRHGTEQLPGYAVGQHSLRCETMAATASALLPRW